MRQLSVKVRCWRAKTRVPQTILSLADRHHIGDLHPMSALASIAEKHSKSRPHAPFIFQRSLEKSISYADLWSHTLAICKWLQDSGFNTGSRIVLVAKNHWLFYPILIACSIRGVTLVPIDPSLNADDFASILSHCGPDLILLEEKKDFASSSEKLKVLLIETLLKEAGDLENIPDVKFEASRKKASNLLMIYTSGTTGGAKAVTLTEANLLANAASLASLYSINAHDKFFCFLPMFHMNAIMITGLVPFVAGASVVLSDLLSFKNAKFFWETVSKYEITVCSLIPSVMSLLLTLFPEGKKEVTKIRFGFCGAAPLPSEVWKKFEQVFKFPIHQGYGLTETTCWAVATPPQMSRRYDIVGIPLNCCEVRIDKSAGFTPEQLFFDRRQDENSGTFSNNQERRRNSPTSEVGEIQIRGSIVTGGYFKDKQLTQNSLTPDGYFRTGDLGFVDIDGFVHVTGRLKEIIIRNGINVSSRDIDEVLQTHPGVKECKTIGIPDETIGERVCSICVLRDDYNVTTKDLENWIRSKVSDFKRPNSIHIHGYLPRTAAGKISIAALRKIITGELADEILKSLNTWKKKRAQPSDPQRTVSIIQAALTKGEKIPFLSYWGFGKRDRLTSIDKMAFDRLLDFVKGAQRLSEVSSELKLILTDVHAQNNRIPIERRERYLNEIKRYAENHEVPCLRLSDLWKKHGFQFDSLDQAIQGHTFKSTWNNLQIQQKLIEQAKKHCELPNDVEAAAKRYFQACQFDRFAIQQEFPNSIFLTYNPPELDALLPELPKLYVFSYKDGTGEKPWFVDDDDAELTSAA